MYKRNKSGQRARLSTEKAKAQTVVAGAYSHRKSEARRTKCQKAGKLWTDEDFEFMKLDRYCSGSIIESVTTKPTRHFKCYLEPWEEMAFDSRGDAVHAAKLSAKYGGLKYIDCDNADQVGTFKEYNGVVLQKCTKDGVIERVPGKVNYYGILGCYEGYDPNLDHTCQVDQMYDIWQRDWSFYEMISDYYKQFPDPKVKIYVQGDVEEDDDGGGKQPAL